MEGEDGSWWQVGSRWNVGRQMKMEGTDTPDLAGIGGELWRRKFWKVSEQHRPNEALICSDDGNFGRKIGHGKKLNLFSGEIPIII